MIANIDWLMQSHKLNALDRRKAEILNRLKVTSGEIWAGDVANYADLDKWRPAFEALVNEGILTKRKAERSRRIYYAFSTTTDQSGGSEPA